MWSRRAVSPSCSSSLLFKSNFLSLTMRQSSRWRHQIATVLFRYSGEWSLTERLSHFCIRKNKRSQPAPYSPYSWSEDVEHNLTGIWRHSSLIMISQTRRKSTIYAACKVNIFGESLHNAWAEIGKQPEGLCGRSIATLTSRPINRFS